MATLSAEQFEALLATITTAASAPVLDISHARKTQQQMAPSHNAPWGQTK